MLNSFSALATGRGLKLCVPACACVCVHCMLRSEIKCRSSRNKICYLALILSPHYIPKVECSAIQLYSSIVDSCNMHITCEILFRMFVYSFLPARRYASAGLCDSDVSVCLSVCLSVCPSVRRTPVLCLAERKQDRKMYTI